SSQGQGNRAPVEFQRLKTPARIIASGASCTRTGGVRQFAALHGFRIVDGGRSGWDGKHRETPGAGHRRATHHVEADTMMATSKLGQHPHTVKKQPRTVGASK